eukprot:720214-Pleurochrysis_carterae.AAC.5
MVSNFYTQIWRGAPDKNRINVYPLRHICASGSVGNDFEWHAKLILGVTADICHFSTRLTVQAPAFFAGGPCLA